MLATSTRILLVDDDPAIQRLLRRWLEKAGYLVQAVSDGRQAMHMIQENTPQLLITDWQMPEFDGVTLCQWLRQQHLPNYVYTIFLSSRCSSEDMVTALESGADDFMKKPVVKGELLARVRAGIRVLELESRLNTLANTDPLTGLATRRTFFELVEREWSRAQRHLIPLSCVMIDIDFFKRINDTFGHRTGDQTLMSIAKILRQNCRDTDIIGRYGGEEFCVLLPETNEEQALLWADRVRGTISQSSILTDHTPIRVTASFGAAQRLADTNSPEKLVDLADQALLVAKRSGRDRAVGFQAISSSETIRSARGSLDSVVKELAARDVMATILAGLKEDDTVGTAVNYFLRFRFHSAPVVDGNGKLVGLLSERDLMGIMLGPNGWYTKIKDVMKRNVVCYEEETPVLVIYEFLSRVSLRGVVIVKDGHPTGMISRASLLRWFTNLLTANPDALAAAIAKDEDASPSPSAPPPKAREKVAALADAISRESASLVQGVRAPDCELVPVIIGSVSRIEELLNDLLSLAGTSSELLTTRSSTLNSSDPSRLSELPDNNKDFRMTGVVSVANW